MNSTRSGHRRLRLVNNSDDTDLRPDPNGTRPIRITGLIPLHPNSPERVAEETRILTEWEELLARLEGHGWVARTVNTMESRFEGTYRKFATLYPIQAMTDREKTIAGIA